MILLLRAISRLAGILLLIVLAAAGLAVAVFAIGSGTGTFSLPGGLKLAGAPDALEQVGRLLGQLAADGPTAAMTLQGAGIAIAAALVLVAGALIPRRERLIALDSEGDLMIRRRALSAITEHLAEGDRSIGAAKARAKPGRVRRGARIRVRVTPGVRRSSSDELRSAATTQLQPLTDSLPLRAKVRARKTAE